MKIVLVMTDGEPVLDFALYKQMRDDKIDIEN